MGSQGEYRSCNCLGALTAACTVFPESPYVQLQSRCYPIQA